MDLLQTPPVVSSCFCGSPSASPGHLTSWLKIHWARIIPTDFGMVSKETVRWICSTFFLGSQGIHWLKSYPIQGLSQWRLAAVGDHLVRSAGDFAADHACQHQGPSGCRGSWGCWRYPTQSRSWVLKVRRERPSADYAHCIFTLRQMTHVANELSYLHLYGRTCLNILIYIYTYWWSCYY